MEKLKPKHDHKLTDIIKVAIFGLMLLLPFISWMPNAFYYGFNEHAVVGQEEQYYNFYQGVKNGKPNSLDYINTEEVLETYVTDNGLETYIETQEGYFNVSYDIDIPLVQSNYYYINIDITISTSLINDVFLEFGDEYDYLYMDYDILTNSNNQIALILQSTGNASVSSSFYFTLSREDLDGYIFYFKDFQIFDLTAIFGSGNEPTKEEFENMLTQEYYNYGNNYVLKDRGTNITWSMYNSWEDVWQTPLFSWTNNSILKTGLNAFCGAFGIVDSSYITNLLVYELVIVAIYIVLDIVLTLFKWLTHIGQKE